MYFWKIDKLKEELSQGPLSEKDSLRYILAWEILWALATIPFLGIEDNNIWDVLEDVIYIPVMVCGILYVYRCNKMSEGKDFLHRYFAIGWVTSVRFTVLVVLPVFIAFAIGTMLSYEELPLETTWMDVVFINLLSVLYFWIFGKHVKDLAYNKAVRNQVGGVE